MSLLLINRSPDLRRLRDLGFEIEVRDGVLLVSSIPYLDEHGGVQRGTFCCPLTLVSPSETGAPPNHVMRFIGGYPHKADGGKITALEHEIGPINVGGGVIADYGFSNKPTSGFTNYFDKVVSYEAVICAHAQAKDRTATARTFKPVDAAEPDSVFLYEDTASSRAGIGALTDKLKGQRLAIIGLGGTGSYVLDALAKAPVAEIHLYDDDLFQQHNAFRSPGAASREALEQRLTKVQRYQDLYSAMRKGVVAHEVRISEVNVDELRQFDYVFVCVDKGDVRRLIYDRLADSSAIFIDTGMDVRVTDNRDALWGTMRVTSSEPESREHVFSHVPMAQGEEEDLYASNIQVIELNALNAMLAIIKWKKLSGFYMDDSKELSASFNTASNRIYNVER